MFFLLLACSDSSLYTKEIHDFVEEQQELIPIDSSLLQPTKMTLYNDGVWIIDEESYLVHHYNMSQQPVESYAFSATPKHIASTENTLIVSTETEIFQFQSENWTSITTTDESISHITIYKGNPAYVINRENTSVIHINSQAIDIPFIQDSIAIYDEHWYILHRDGKTLYELILDDDFSTYSVTEQHIFDDIPHQMILQQDRFFVTTRSFRWPYAGWIVELEDSNGMLQEHRLSETPPEPEWIGVTDNYVYWSSKQSITRIHKEGGIFEMIAPQTTVGNLLAVNHQVWWTDHKGGRVFVYSE